MENIVNCYELDFVKDIPTEMTQLNNSCIALRKTNQRLKYLLAALVVGMGAYVVYRRVREEDLR